MKRRVSIRTEDFLAAPEPPTLVKGLIVRCGVTGLSADPNVGKTFLALKIAQSVLTGRPLLDRFEVKRGSVLFIGQDAGSADYARQARKVFGTEPHEHRNGQNPYAFARWMLHQGLDLKRPADVAELVEIANRIPNQAFDPHEIINVMPDVDPDGKTTWRPVFAKPHGTSLIVLDTLSKMHSAEENSNTEMNRVFDNLRHLSEKTQSAVLLLHHHSYGGEHNPGGRWRGASGQDGALDGWFELRGRGVDTKHVRVRKFRGVRPDDFSYRMVADETSARFEALDSTSPVPARSEQDADVVQGLLSSLGEEFATGDVIAVLAEGAWSSVAESTRRRRVTNALTELVARRAVEGIGRGRWHVLTNHD